MEATPSFVYRITHKKWSNTLTASGIASRWNSNGFFMLYTSETTSLACLENLAHRNNIGMNAMFEVMQIQLPKKISIQTIKLSDLPKDWNDITEKGKVICRKLGDEWMKSQKSCILKVPSVIIPNENNYLLNCTHKEFSGIKIKQHFPFEFDNRLG